MQKVFWIEISHFWICVNISDSLDSQSKKTLFFQGKTNLAKNIREVLKTPMQDFSFTMSNPGYSNSLFVCKDGEYYEDYWPGLGCGNITITPIDISNHEELYFMLNEVATIIEYANKKRFVFGKDKYPKGLFTNIFYPPAYSKNDIYDLEHEHSVDNYNAKVCYKIIYKMPSRIKSARSIK